jgi:hypothetical protein
MHRNQRKTGGRWLFRTATGTLLLGATALPARAAPWWTPGPWLRLHRRERALEAHIGALESRVAALESRWEPLALTADCAGGESVADALARGRLMSGPLTITIHGVCNERIVIDRDDVTIRGASSSDGLEGTGLTGTTPLVTIVGAQRVTLSGLRLTPMGLDGVKIDAGTSLTTHSVEIDGAAFGFVLEPDTSARLSTSNVLNSQQTGILSNGGYLELSGCFINYNSGAGVSMASGILEMYGTTVRGNASWGVSVIDNGTARIYDSTIAENATGLFLRIEASASLGSGTRIADNNGIGVRVWDASTLLLGYQSIVENNDVPGVHVIGDSVVVPLANAVIRNNNGDGIQLRDTSLATSTSGSFPEISGNAGWGVRCEGDPADARLGTPGYPATAVFGNTMGQISCPGFMIP